MVSYLNIIYITFFIFLVLSVINIILNIIIIHDSNENPLDLENEYDKYGYFIDKPKKFIYCFCEKQNF